MQIEQFQEWASDFSSWIMEWKMSCDGNCNGMVDQQAE